MRVLVRFATADRFVSVLLALLLLHGEVVQSQFNARTTAATARRADVRDLELQRSLARYRLLLQHDDSRPDSLVKAETLPEISPEQEEQTETKTNTDNAVEHAEEKVDEWQSVVELEEPKGAEILDQLIEQQIEPHEVKSEEKIQAEEPEVDKVKTATVEGEHSAPTNLEQQEQGEEQKEKEVKKTELESHPNAEIREELQSNDQVKEEIVSNADKEENSEEWKGSERKPEEQQPEAEKEVAIKTEENKSEEWKESASKPEEESEASIEEGKADEVREEPFVFPEPYLLGPPIKDWDEQRGDWLNSNPHMKTTSDGKPRVLIVTGSQPNPCHSPVGDHFNVKSLKNKIDYARMHNYEIYYSFVWLDPLFGSYWVKLPTLRKLMLTHPEIEWFFWVDSDAIFTDMLFEAPLHTYDSEGIDMVMWGFHHGFYVEKSWVGFNAGVFIIRNCQWSLDLIDKWSPMGPDGPVRVEYGKMLSSYLTYRIDNYPADDQSALAYVILTDEAIKSKVKLVELTEYMLSAWWIEVVDNYETSMEKYHPGLGDRRWPFITHFTGCGPCNGDSRHPDYGKCMKNIERALNFADNQVLAYMGFQHESLSSESLIRTRNESNRPLELLGVNPWEERIAERIAQEAASAS